MSSSQKVSTYKNIFMCHNCAVSIEEDTFSHIQNAPRSSQFATVSYINTLSGMGKFYFT